MWVRGLKLKCLKTFIMMSVAPHVGAWIETAANLTIDTDTRSHPMWVRGLKHRYAVESSGFPGRTPCGCVD